MGNAERRCAEELHGQELPRKSVEWRRYGIA
nr:MAG TPA: coagulation factor IX-binding protein [Caudoviricetes sp.]